jgi:alpha-tubulin suppressor-like RCC1 family protein
VDNKGRFFFVQDVCGYRYSDGTSWTNEYNTSISATDVYTWGVNCHGQLATNTISSRSSPGTIVGSIRTWCDVSAGNNHTAAVKTDGSAWTWGCNNCGQLGDETVTCRSSPGQTMGGGSTWCQISAGCEHTAAVKTDGSAWTWGRNTGGQLGDNTTVCRSSPVEVVHATGNFNWCQISAGDQHTAAIKQDGTAWNWGCNHSGQLGNNAAYVAKSSPVTPTGGGTTWCQISAGGAHTAAVKYDCTVWLWGRNLFCQLGDGTGTSRSSPVITSGGGSTWCHIDAGGEHTAAVKTDGTAWTWGRGNEGQLGIGVAGFNRNSPVQTSSGGTTWCQISAGTFHTAAVKTDSTAWSWGLNTCGQLGDNTVFTRAAPVVVTGGGTTWCQISAGSCHTAAIAICTPIFSEPL